MTNDQKATARGDIERFADAMDALLYEERGRVPEDTRAVLKAENLSRGSRALVFSR